MFFWTLTANIESFFITVGEDQNFFPINVHNVLWGFIYKYMYILKGKSRLFWMSFFPLDL